MQTAARLFIASVLAIFAATVSAARSDAPAPSRGEQLYQNHCTFCHTSVAHLRSDRRATSVAAVEAWVRRWVDHQKLGWGDSDVAEVTQHLVDRYYRFGAKTPERK